VVVFFRNVGRFAKVDAHPMPQDGFAVEDFADLDGAGDGGEGYDYASEGLEGREGVQRDLGFDGGFYGGEVGFGED